MTRTRLADRRYSETHRVEVEMDLKPKIILVTIGFDERGRPSEVFCADFKAGTSMHGIVMDACIVLSRLLQHGDDPADILRGMSGGPADAIEGMADADHRRSLIGRIAEIVVEASK